VGEGGRRAVCSAGRLVAARRPIWWIPSRVRLSCRCYCEAAGLWL